MRFVFAPLLLLALLLALALALLINFGGWLLDELRSAR